MASHYLLLLIRDEREGSDNRNLFFEKEVHLVSLTRTRSTQRTEARNLSYEKDPTEYGGKQARSFGRESIRGLPLFTVYFIEWRISKSQGPKPANTLQSKFSAETGS